MLWYVQNVEKNLGGSTVCLNCGNDLSNNISQYINNMQNQGALAIITIVLIFKRKGPASTNSMSSTKNISLGLKHRFDPDTPIMIDKTGKKVLGGLDNYNYVEETDLRVIDDRVYD